MASFDELPSDHVTTPVPIKDDFDPNSGYEKMMMPISTPFTHIKSRGFSSKPLTSVPVKTNEEFREVYQRVKSRISKS